MAQYPAKTGASGRWSLQDQRTAVLGDNWPIAAITLEYLVIAGGGGGGASQNAYASGGGGGAGGYRSSVAGESSGGGVVLNPQLM